MKTGDLRIPRTFAQCRLNKRKVLVAYLCVGDPSLEESLDLALACIQSGADMVELGVPFSDPTADGPAIARASQRAIAKGGGLAPTLAMAKKLRLETALPIVLFGYYNPIFVRGEARVADEASEAGVDSLLIVDLPIEEGAELRTRAAEHGIPLIPLLTPTSSASRIDAVKRAAAKWPMGFVYYVSVTGVTGSVAVQAGEAGLNAARIRDTLRLPVVVGFGIDSREKARAACENADGVVVGTALVRAIEDGATAAERSKKVRHLVSELRAGLDG